MRFSEGYIPDGLAGLAHPDGVLAVVAECARQHVDARQTLVDNAGVATALADTLRRASRVTLLGMGGSHFVNQIVAARLRTLGIDAVAITASEALYAPPANLGEVLLTSQSGGSAEIVKWRQQQRDTKPAAGITLDTAEPFGKIPTLVGAGGAEHAFAATRSFTLSLAVFAALFDALGADESDHLPCDEPPVNPGIRQAIEQLGKVHSFVVSGRAAFDGMAGMTALSLMELARMPALCMEGGQLRHGAVEMFSNKVGLIVFRPSGPSAGHWQGIIDIAGRAGTPVVVFDSSGLPELNSALSLNFDPGEGIGALYAMAPTEQALVLGLAALHVNDPGIPAFCSKVTDTE